MAFITQKVNISQADFIELQSKQGRWSLREYAYWAAKFCTGYPVEGYDMYNPRIEEIKKKKYSSEYYIIWECKDNCD